MLKYHSMLFAIALWLVGLLCAGCGVKGEHVDVMRYESKDDSFELLHSWTNLRCANDSQVDHVEFLWKRRESIITTPFAFLWTAPAIERLGNHRLRWIDLTAPTTDPSRDVAAVDLDSIKVIPGEFYLNGHANLCYYHQIVVPGKTMDAILFAASPFIADKAAEFAKDEIRKIETNGRKHPSWDDVRKSMMHELAERAGIAPNAPKETAVHETSPLDAISLRRLVDAKKQNSITISRKRNELSLVLPLSPADCRESIATFDLFRKTIAQYVIDGRPIDDGLEQMLQAIAVRDIDGVGLEVSVNLSKAANAAVVANKSRMDAEPQGGSNPGHKSTVEKIQRRGIPINPSFSIEGVFERYLAK